jgi:hypothetical protein
MQKPPAKMPTLMQPDMDLVKQLAQNFSIDACFKQFLSGVEMIANAAGVKVTCTINSIDKEKIVDRELLTQGVSKLTTSMGFIMAGGHVNPIRQLNQASKVIRDEPKA